MVVILAGGAYFAKHAIDTYQAEQDRKETKENMMDAEIMRQGREIRGLYRELYEIDQDVEDVEDHITDIYNIFLGDEEESCCTDTEMIDMDCKTT